jgi:hypothetical protein
MGAPGAGADECGGHASGTHPPGPVARSGIALARRPRCGCERRAQRELLNLLQAHRLAGVSTVKIIMGKGFGFVTFDETAQAMAAVRAMNGLKCGAKCLKGRGRRRRRRRHGRRRFLSSPRHCIVVLVSTARARLRSARAWASG